MSSNTIPERHERLGLFVGTDVSFAGGVVGSSATLEGNGVGRIVCSVVGIGVGLGEGGFVGG